MTAKQSKTKSNRAPRLAQDQEPKVPAKPWTPSDRERQLVEAYFERRTAADETVPRFKNTADKNAPKTVLEPKHSDQTTWIASLDRIFAQTGNADAISWLVDQTGNVSTLANSQSHDDRARDINAAVAMVDGIRPADALETMLAVQMVGIHSATADCLRRANLPQQTFEGRQANINQANKLARTFAAQIEALNRHRGKGQQKVTVEHVHVHEGGQAIVGSVEGGGVGRKVGG